MRTLREWRARRLLSTKALAAKASVSNKTIVQLENGHGLPIFRTIGRISAALGVEPGEVAEFAAAIATRGGVNDADTATDTQGRD